jgi:hypothetical protein
MACYKDSFTFYFTLKDLCDKVMLPKIKIYIIFNNPYRATYKKSRLETQTFHV